MKKPSRAVEQWQPLSQMRMSILHALDSLLTAIDENDVVSRPLIDISGHGCSTQLNDLLLGSGVRGMLERKDYRAVDMIFSIIEVYINCTTEF